MKTNCTPLPQAACERAMMESHENKSAVYSREEELQRAREMIQVYEQDQHRLQLDLQVLLDYCIHR